MSQALPLNVVAELSDETFATFQKLTLQHTGIQLADNKRSMILTRFARRLSVLGLDNYEAYVKLLCEAGNPEMSEFVDTITTNLTYFFREPHHFEVLKKDVLPSVTLGRNPMSPIRIWSAGCSSGQEPYSIAITAKETPQVGKHPVKILCTDIHTKMVRTTQTGIYNQEALRGLTEEQRNHWFVQVGDSTWQAETALREMLICKQLNLFGPWPVRPGVDVIMCRNVLIYFSPAYQRKLLMGFASVQKPGSYLFIGHSETLDGLSKEYKRVANTVYQRQ